MIRLEQIKEEHMDFYDCGIPSEYIFKIMDEECQIGLIYVNKQLDESLYIEWLEIMTPFRGRKYLRNILNALSEYSNINTFYFESSKENLIKYRFAGARDLGLNQDTGLYKMRWCKGER